MTPNEAFGSMGPSFGLAGDTLEPPTNCTTDFCNNAPLTQRREYTGTLFTLRRGVLPITIVSMYCHHCQTTYHHDHKIRHASEALAQREYYEGLPEYIMVSMHIVVECPLVALWETQMMHSHTSAEGASRIYNAALRTRTSDSEEMLQPHTVWDSFFLHALLRDAVKQDYQLSVPHHGLNNERLNAALKARNARMVGTGQDQWAHACSACMKVKGKTRLSACTTDGVTVGHVCCGVHDCKIPLSNQRAWFCPSHNGLRFVCAVNGCTQPVSEGWRTCLDQAHRAYEVDRRMQGKAMFRLRARLARTNGETEPQIPTAPVKIRGRLSRRWTHNEQLMVRCCGVILSRATFFGSEAITSVKDFIHVTFPVHYPGSLPSFIYYDSACLLIRHLMVSPDPQDARLAAVGFPVDTFHASRKHKESDAFCIVNCSPVAYPELMEGTTWIFNSSVAEQTNAWFVKFHPIVKEMSVLRYNFFLDEMISLRNEWRVEKLRVAGEKPHFIPLEDLETRIPLL
ncbi:hypothetical protein C8R43DRAFT_1072732 [Mycena crocata]|nr:hypothetical protein C8R43DRAFT_1072732 [Mycena crocata]